jgi:Trypsin-like peptidase domain
MKKSRSTAARAKTAKKATKTAKKRTKKRTKKSVKKSTKKAAAKKTAAKKTASKPAKKQAAAPAPRARPSAKASRTRPRPVDPAYYKRMLAGVGARRGGAAEGLEAASPFESFEVAGPTEGVARATAAEPDLSHGAINERVDSAKAELHRIVKDYLGDDAALYGIADEIAASARPALAAMRDAESVADTDVLAGLEVIVRTDGSRPSFMVRNGDADTATSPVGTWDETMRDSAAALRDAIACIGRIDDPAAPQGFHGTGIQVAADLVMTNRHVLQEIATQAADGGWKLKPNIAIDFGHEFRGTDTLRRRAIKSIVFAGAKPIDPFRIDHAKLDLALLELAAGEAPARVLGVDLARDWGLPDTNVFIVGYPGNPGQAGGPPSLLEKLFKSTFGCKRLAPGLISTSADRLAESPRHWSAGHDATTLGGNSGSAVVVIGREKITAGLHYGGTRADPRENWCHVIGLTLDETDGRSNKTLRQHFAERGVELADRV